MPRDDWFGEPWRKSETVILIHGMGNQAFGNISSSARWVSAIQLLYFQEREFSGQRKAEVASPIDVVSAETDANEE